MILVDATSNSGAQASVNSTTWAHTVGTSGGNRLLVVCVSGFDTTGDKIVTGVTYNGVAMTQAVAIDGGNNYASSIWYLVAPATGANNVIVTYTGNVNFVGASAISFYNVKQTSPADGSGTSNATGNPSTSVTTTYNNSVLVDALYSEQGSDLTVGAGQTAIAQIAVNSGGDRAISSYKITTASGAQTMSWTGSALYVGAGAGFLAIPEGGAFLFNLL